MLDQVQTFEQWFDEEFCPSFHYTNQDPMTFYSAARAAWDASYAATVEQSEDM